MTATIATCANACLNCDGRGYVSAETFDSDTERLVVIDYRCRCQGTRCMACEFGDACWVTSKTYTEPSSSQFWDEGGAEDFARFDD